MKILEWNISHGGSDRRFYGILNSIDAHDAEVVVLTEYHSEHRETIADHFKNLEYPFIFTSIERPRTNGIFIASRLNAKLVKPICVPADYSHRWLEIEVSDLGYNILGLYLPTSADPTGKATLWSSILEYAKSHSEKQVLMIGDFNTGLSVDTEGSPFTHTDSMEELLKLGWIDTWRHRNPSIRDYSWYSNAGNGFRLDYAYSSPRLYHRISKVEFSHKCREDGHSDHSAISVEISD